MSTAVRRVAVLIAAVLAAGLVLAACADSEEFSPPRSYTVAYNQQCYVGYEYDEHEADMLNVPANCTRVLYPSYTPTFDAGDYLLRMMLWEHLLRYNSYYHSPMYYDRYLSPMAGRYPGVTIINRNSYITTNNTFTTQNRTAITTQSKGAVWADGKKGARSFPAPKAPAKAAPAGTTKRDGGTTNSRDTSATKPKAVTKPAPPAPVRRR